MPCMYHRGLDSTLWSFLSLCVCIGLHYIAEMLYVLCPHTSVCNTVFVLNSRLNISGEEAVKANTIRCIKSSYGLVSDACDSEMWDYADTQRLICALIRRMQQEVKWHSSYESVYDRQTRQTEQQVVVFLLRCNECVVSPCRMDWFKLQRFEKVFNASSTRIVTKKGVK